MSTLEERALADSDDSDRFAKPKRSDAITSLVAASNMAGKAMGERDRARLALVAMTAEAEDQRAAYGFLEVEVAEQVAKVTERDEVIENWRAAHHRLWVECDSAITSLRDRNATIERVRALLNEATNMPAHYSIEGAAGPCQSCDQPASTHYHLIGGGCMNSDLQAADDRRAL